MKTKCVGWLTASALLCSSGVASAQEPAAVGEGAPAEAAPTGHGHDPAYFGVGLYGGLVLGGETPNGNFGFELGFSPVVATIDPVTGIAAGVRAGAGLSIDKFVTSSLLATGALHVMLYPDRLVGAGIGAGISGTGDGDEPWIWGSTEAFIETASVPIGLYARMSVGYTFATSDPPPGFDSLDDDGFDDGFGDTFESEPVMETPYLGFTLGMRL